MNVQAPKLPVVANVTGELYPTTKDEIVDILGRQVASPVQFVKGMQTMYDDGARVLVEIGPKRVLNSLATDNLKDQTDVTVLSTNHPRKGGKASFNEALCGLFAAGIGGVEIRCNAQAVSPTVTTEVMQPISDGKVRFPDRWLLPAQDWGCPAKHTMSLTTIMSSAIDRQNMIDPLPDTARQGMLEKMSPA